MPPLPLPASGCALLASVMIIRLVPERSSKSVVGSLYLAARFLLQWPRPYLSATEVKMDELISTARRERTLPARRSSQIWLSAAKVSRAWLR